MVVHVAGFPEYKSYSVNISRPSPIDAENVQLPPIQIGIQINLWIKELVNQIFL